MKVWRRLRGWLHRRVRLRQLLIMAVPSARLGRADGVAAMWHRIATHAPRRQIVLLERWCEHLRAALPAPVGKTRLILVLFAHPAPQFTGFAVNRGIESPREVLLRGWWEDPDVSFDLLVAHVCNGASVVGDAAWHEVFPNWVSYGEFVSAFYDSDGAVERWNRVTEATVNAGLAGGSMRHVADRIRFAYIKEMIDIDEAGVVGDGDPLNFMYFQGALDALRTSDDRR